MANEAVCIETPKTFVRYTVADGTTISKGCLLKLSADPNTAIASSGTGDCFAGIAWEQKLANDGQTEIGAAIDGTFDITTAAVSGITLGNIVALSGANLIRTAIAADIISGAIVGKVLETATGGEVVRVRIGFI